MHTACMLPGVVVAMKFLLLLLTALQNKGQGEIQDRKLNRED